MAEKINVKEDNDDEVFQYFSGVNEEIFKKLPKPDKRPYSIIGILSFCIILFFSALIFLVANTFSNSVFLNIAISIAALVLIYKLHRTIVARLIHLFNSSSKLIFLGYAVIISLLFIICLKFNTVRLPILTNTYETTTTDTTTTMAYPVDTITSYPDTTTKIESITDPKK
jgi:hypothetical protein